MLDLLVLLRARRLVGNCLSTFSLLLRELRAVAGVPRETFLMVGDAPHVWCAWNRVGVLNLRGPLPAAVLGQDARPAGAGPWEALPLGQQA